MIRSGHSLVFVSCVALEDESVIAELRSGGQSDSADTVTCFQITKVHSGRSYFMLDRGRLPYRQARSKVEDLQLFRCDTEKERAWLTSSRRPDRDQIKPGDSHTSMTSHRA
jgi:hypothetical protein